LRKGRDEADFDEQANDSFYRGHRRNRIIQGQPSWILIFIPSGKAFAKVFQVAPDEQRITPELRVALDE
jgi:hypothetical protein